MEIENITSNNIEGLIEELSDEELTDCVGGTGYINPAGKPLGHGTLKKYDGEDRNKAIKDDPNGSWRAWGYWSDRNRKENFAPVDSQDVLAKVVNLPIEIWNYKEQNSEIRHMGPMAQDFAAAFELGESDRMINPIDANGVAFAAIQALHQQLQERDAQLRAMRADLENLKQQMRETLMQPSTAMPVAALSCN
ncbi:MAG: tail fiber domain-containing protein [Cyanobacteriota bacterium]